MFNIYYSCHSGYSNGYAWGNERDPFLPVIVLK